MKAGSHCGKWCKLCKMWIRIHGDCQWKMRPTHFDRRSEPTAIDFASTNAVGG